MPINGFNIPNTLVIPLGAVPLDGCPDALSCLLRVRIPAEAYFLLPQCSVEALNSPYGLRMAKGNTPMNYAQLGASLLKSSWFLPL